MQPSPGNKRNNSNYYSRPNNKRPFPGNNRGNNGPMRGGGGRGGPGPGPGPGGGLGGRRMNYYGRGGGGGGGGGPPRNHPYNNRPGRRGGPFPNHHNPNHHHPPPPPPHNHPSQQNFRRYPHPPPQSFGMNSPMPPPNGWLPPPPVAMGPRGAPHAHHLPPPPPPPPGAMGYPAANRPPGPPPSRCPPPNIPPPPMQNIMGMNQTAHPPPSQYHPLNQQPMLGLHQQTSMPSVNIQGSSNQLKTATSASTLPPNWSEYSMSNGKKYYYNSVTKKSTFERPAMPTSATTTKANEQKSQSKSKEKRKWKIYKEAKSGKEYYSDGVTSTWEKPADFCDDSDKKSKSEENSANGDSNHNDELFTSFGSKKEGKEVFVQLLREKGVGSSSKWQEVVKQCSNDYRWNACESKSERKQALAEFQGKCLKEDRERKRIEEKQARDNFHELLSEIKGIDIHSRFDDFVGELSSDSRWHEVAEESQREEYFYDYIDDLEKKGIRDKRWAQKLALDNFIALLKASNVSCSSTWRSFYDSLDRKKREDPSIAAISSDHEKQRYFADYVADLRRSENEEKRKLRLTESADIEEFRNFLVELSKKRTITLSSSWDSTRDNLKSEDSYGKLEKHGKSLLKLTFEDHMKDLRYTYRRDRAFISHLVSQNVSKLSKGMAYEEFRDFLLDASGKAFESDCQKVLNRLSISSAEICYEELMANGYESLLGESNLSSLNNDVETAPEVDVMSEEGELSEEGEIEDGEGAPPLNAFDKRRVLD